MHCLIYLGKGAAIFYGLLVCAIARIYYVNRNSFSKNIPEEHDFPPKL